MFVIVTRDSKISQKLLGKLKTVIQNIQLKNIYIYCCAKSKYRAKTEQTKLIFKIILR